MYTAEQLITHLDLKIHPEGGYYREVYRSVENLPAQDLPSGFTGPRSISTSIYFLLLSGQKSNLHKIKSDELWFFHLGNPLTIYMIDDECISTLSLGPELHRGQSLQVMVPAGRWFGAIPEGESGYCLCSCTVAPGFDFADFELAEREKLLQDFPAFTQEILMLTNP